jgi:hypothetical protein
MAAFDSSESMKQAAASMTGAVNAMLAGVGNISVSLNGMGQGFTRMQSAMDRFVEGLNASVQRLVGGLGAAQGVPAEAAALTRPMESTAGLGRAGADLDAFAANLSTSTDSLDALAEAAMLAGDSLRQTGEKTGSMFDSISESLKGFDLVLKPAKGLNLKEMTADEHKGVQGPKAGEQRRERERERRKGRFERFGETIQPYTARAGRMGGSLVGSAVGGVAGAVTGSMAGGVGALPGALAGSASGGKMGGAMGGFLGGLTGKIGAVIDTVVGAFGTFFSTLMKAAAVVNTFVAAFNPALVQMFTLTIKDLMAVIGAGLQPITSALTLVFRALADSLVPIMAKLQPAFEKLGEAVIQFLVPIFSAMAEVLGGLTPSLNEFAAVVAKVAGQVGGMIGEVIKGLEPIIQIAIDVMNPLISFIGDLIEAITPVMTAFNIVARVLGTFVGLIMDYVGPALSILGAGLRLIGDGIGYIVGLFDMLATGIENFMDILAHPYDRFMGNETEFQKKQRAKDEAKENSRRGLTGASIGAAAQPAQYSAVEDLSKNLIKAAFSGSGNDRLNQIANNTGKQVQLLEQIAAKGNKDPFPNRAGADFGRGV